MLVSAFTLMEPLFYSLVETFLPSKPRCLNQQSPKLWGWEAKNKTKYKTYVSLVCLILRELFHLLILGAGKKQHQTLAAKSKHMLHPGEHYPNPTKFHPIDGPINESSKSHPTIQSGKLLQGSGG